ncbi:hypothetical protein HELRODRAFT_164938 [Helobdella robusta]|uniref:Uncharacterized protein n=1 Tax=Helobdella robusta TaxID=6412 RepID=T1EVZ9_HELRO|nr:hypothetical protein HELRODRAFT_164938 [Helobdella robusta]ESN92815.1 hypothetical protein HELRODRAFT_164938 [Helobdella robusta]
MILAAKNVYKNAAGGTLTGKKLNIDWKTEKPIDNLVLKKFASKFPDLEMKVNTIKPFLYIIQWVTIRRIITKNSRSGVSNINSNSLMAYARFQAYHALKTLRSHGLRDIKLFDITESLIISHIKYAALS